MRDISITLPAVGPYTPDTRAPVKRRRGLLRRLARLGLLTGTLLLASAPGFSHQVTQDNAPNWGLARVGHQGVVEGSAFELNGSTFASGGLLGGFRGIGPAGDFFL